MTAAWPGPGSGLDPGGVWGPLGVSGAFPFEGMPACLQPAGVKRVRSSKKGIGLRLYMKVFKGS